MLYVNTTASSKENLLEETWEIWSHLYSAAPNYVAATALSAHIPGMGEWIFLFLLSTEDIFNYTMYSGVINILRCGEDGSVWCWEHLRSQYVPVGFSKHT